MTLITYISRVHFADGVLEIALSSELELNKMTRPLLVSEQHAVSKEFSDRVSAGIPFWCTPRSHQIKNKEPTGLSLSKLRECIHATDADVVVAYGSALALSLTDACCRSISDNNSARASNAPEFFAIPGVDGIPSMSMPRNSSSRTPSSGVGIQPAMVIVDPTLMLGESTERTASAAANALARCLSAHFSSAYNPPADGIAVEGFKRIARNISAIAVEDTLEMRRELMAASLNATLAMQKNPGLALELCKIMLRSTKLPLDEGALMRLLIVIEAELMEAAWTGQRESEIRTTLGVSEGVSLKGWLSSILSKLVLPGSLTELGLNDQAIADAAREFAAGRAALVPSADVLIKMLKNVTLEPVKLSGTHEFA